jgi:hypothetical protein
VKKKKYRWFVRCLDGFTNRRVCEHFDISSDGTDKLLHQRLVVYSDGSRRKVDLIRITTDQKNILLQASKNNQYQFELYVQQGKGQIHFCPKKFAVGTALFLQVFEGVSMNTEGNDGEVETEEENEEEKVN